MPLTRTVVWGEGSTPTPAELNAEFNNIIAKFSSGITAGDISDDILQADSTAINAGSYDTLAEAVIAASAAGKDVIIPPGTYDADTSPIDIPANMHIIGAGASLVTIRPAVGYASSVLIRLNGENSGISGVTLDVNNLSGSNYNFEMLRIDVTNAASVVIRDCDFTTTSLASGVSASLLSIAAGVVRSEIVQVYNCQFDASGATSGSIVRGIDVDVAHSLKIEQCSFTDFSSHSIYIESCRQARIRYNKFDRSSESLYNLCHINGQFQLEGNYFYSNHDFTATNGGLYLEAFSNVPVMATVNNNVFLYSGIVTNYPAYCISVKGNVNCFDNYGAAGTTGFATSFILYQSRTIRNNPYIIRNTVNAGTIYSANGDSIWNQFHEKKWDAVNPFRMGDVFAWVYHTGTTNYLYFKQGGRPSSATDYDSYITLSGMTTSLAD